MPTDPTVPQLSVRATYDSRETGPRFHVTTCVNGRTVEFRKPLDDPFVRTTVRVGVRDVLAALLRGRRPSVEVTVGADVEVMNDVLELDEKTLIPGRTRQAAFRQSVHGKLKRAVLDRQAGAEGDQSKDLLIPEEVGVIDHGLLPPKETS